MRLLAFSALLSFFTTVLISISAIFGAGYVMGKVSCDRTGAVMHSRVRFEPFAGCFIQTKTGLVPMRQRGYVTVEN